MKKPFTSWQAKKSTTTLSSVNLLLRKKANTVGESFNYFPPNLGILIFDRKSHSNLIIIVFTIKMHAETASM